MSMAVSYEKYGRTMQKSRTRTALVASARNLLAEGVHPTVEDAAAAAGVSRATAYRYFPNQRALVLAAHPEIAATSLLGDAPPSDPEERLERVVGEFVRLTLATEAQLRMMLRLSLDPDSSDELVLRQGRAIGWIDEALAPLRGTVPRATLRRLVLAIRSSCGIEALVWLVDVAGLSREEAAKQMRWAALELLRATRFRHVPV